MTIREYSLMINDSLVEGATQFRKEYRTRLPRGEQIGEKYLVNMGEINHVAVIVKNEPVIPNLIMIGLSELINEAETEITLNNKFKLHQIE